MAVPKIAQLLGDATKFSVRAVLQGAYELEVCGSRQSAKFTLGYQCAQADLFASVASDAFDYDSDGCGGRHKFSWYEPGGLISLKVCCNDIEEVYHLEVVDGNIKRIHGPVGA